MGASCSVPSKPVSNRDTPERCDVHDVSGKWKIPRGKLASLDGLAFFVLVFVRVPCLFFLLEALGGKLLRCVQGDAVRCLCGWDVYRGGFSGEGGGGVARGGGCERGLDLLV